MLHKTSKTTKMKKNLLGALVIFFVTVAILLVIDDISKSKNSESNNVDTYIATQQSDLVTTDDEE